MKHALFLGSIFMITEQYDTLSANEACLTQIGH